jgi:hypothetical protein
MIFASWRANLSDVLVRRSTGGSAAMEVPPEMSAAVFLELAATQSGNQRVPVLVDNS